MTRHASLPRLLMLAAGLFAAFAFACTTQSAADDPTPTPGSPTATPTDPPTATPTAPPTATPTPTVTPDPYIRGIIVGSNINAWAEPRTGSGSLRVYQQGDIVRVVREVKGQDWIVDGQTFNITNQGWFDTWYEVEGGGYIYTAWILFPREGETLPSELPFGDRWVYVDTDNQVLTFYVGETPYFTAQVSTGKPGYESPAGSWRVHTKYEDKTMSSVGLNYPPAEQYVVRHVLFTQFFSNMGDALHLNYWRPLGVFGNTATSHGCIGLLLHDAQWLWLAGQDHNLRVEVGGSRAADENREPGGV